MARTEKPDERVVLAGEYVLGTLDEPTHKQAELLLTNSLPFKRDVWFWERRFARLGLRLRPIEPRMAVWLSIRRRIGKGRVVSRGRHRARLVKAWAYLATAASVVLAVVAVREAQRPPQTTIVRERIEVPVVAPVYVAVLQMKDAPLHWAVSAVPGTRQLKVRADGEVPATLVGQDTELWLIGDAGPVSLGVIPQSGEGFGTLPQGAMLRSGAVLAVSVEPKGGSPTGSPTGPVVSTGAVVRVS